MSFWPAKPEQRRWWATPIRRYDSRREATDFSFSHCMSFRVQWKAKPSGARSSSKWMEKITGLWRLLRSPAVINRYRCGCVAMCPIRTKFRWEPGGLRSSPAPFDHKVQQNPRRFDECVDFYILIRGMGVAAVSAPQNAGYAEALLKNEQIAGTFDSAHLGLSAEHGGGALLKRQHERLVPRNRRAGQPAHGRAKARHSDKNLRLLAHHAFEPGGEFAIDRFACFARHSLPVEFDERGFGNGDRLAGAPGRGDHFRYRHGNRIDERVKELVVRSGPFSLLGKLGNSLEKTRQLRNHALRKFSVLQHPAGRLELDMLNAAAALGGTEAQRSGLAQYDGVGVITAQTARERSIGSAEFLVSNGFKEQIAGELDAELREHLDNEQVSGDARLHIVGSTTVEPIAFDRAAEWIAGPGLRPARNRVDVAG